MCKVTLLTLEQYQTLSDKGRKEHHNVFYYFHPGTAWLNPWYFDPTDPEDLKTIDQEKKLGVKSLMSQHYWNDWAHIRPPITVVCPDGSLWMIDQKSSNGTGWTITGEDSDLTASPSIHTSGYHGWLQNGHFTPDLENRHYPTVKFKGDK